MGTSNSLKAGSGGDWTGLKTQITGHFTGSRSISFSGVVRDTVRAAGGIGIGARGRARGLGASGSGGGAAVGPVIGGLGGFGVVVRDSGLADGLERLGLSELVGKSAIEVVASIAEHLAASVDGLDGELLRGALRDAILDAAALGDSDGFADLEHGLQSYLSENGPAGLVELFLCRFVFDAVWSNVEAYAQSKASNESAFNTFMSAVEGVCDAQVRGVISDARVRGEFDKLDWFGRDGQRIGRAIFDSVEQRLRGLVD